MSVGEITEAAAAASGAEAAPEPTSLRDTGPRSDVVVALAQIAPRLGEVGPNLQRHLELIAEARRRGADVIVFPELSLTGYFLKDLVPDVAVRLQGEEIAELCAAAQDIDVVCGAVLEEDDHRFYNAGVYLAGGEIAHVHRKVYLPTYGLFDEGRYFAQGSRFRTFEAGAGQATLPRAWRAAMLVCEDLWHPTSLSLLARQGIDVVIVLSASPGRGVGKGFALGTARSYDAMTRTYAQLHTTYLVFCNRVGYEDGVNFWGGSRVVDPRGHVDGEPAGKDETLQLHRIDLAVLRRARIINPLLRDERHDIVDTETDRLRRRAGDRD
ncbi:MAG: nitrilase-related carbon-nitrogen hydrolase [Candidatus Dormibacteria bacterium]